VLVKPSIAGVSIGPGLIALTRIFRAFRSLVQERAKERTAALVALYTLNFSDPFDEVIEAFKRTDAEGPQKRFSKRR
jgi:hypothetical protein